MNQEDLEFQDIRYILSRRGMDGGMLPGYQVRQKTASPQSCGTAPLTEGSEGTLRRFWVAAVAAVWVLLTAVAAIGSNLEGRWF